jgi:AraC family transcriptional regulator
MPHLIPDNPAELSAAETHGIALWPAHQLITHSEGRGWRNLYVSLARHQPYDRTLPAVDHHCLAYCLSRSATVSRQIDGQRTAKVQFEPRQFGIIPPGVSSHWSVAGGPEIVLVYLHASLMRQVAAEVFDRDPDRIELVPGLGMADALLEQLVLNALGELRQADAGVPLYADSIATMAAVHLLRHHATRPAVDRGLGSADLARSNLRPALDFIEASLEDNPSIAEIAATTGLSTFYFARAFRRQLGMAPHQYLMARRVERAKTLLATSDQPLAELALSAGFASQSHLTAIFKRVVGVTPGAYRRS